MLEQLGFVETTASTDIMQEIRLDMPRATLRIILVMRK